MARKLGRATDQRMAVLKNQVSMFLWNGKLETTLDRAKEVRRLAEKYITLAMRTYEDTVEVTKTKTNLKGDKTDVKFTNDGVKKLNARRRLMACLYDLQEIRGEKEKGSEFNARKNAVNHPLVEKLFNDYAPKYAAREKEKGQGGGYTRILKLGARRGDAAEKVLLVLVD